MEKTVKLLIIVIAIFTLGIGLYACNDKDNADMAATVGTEIDNLPGDPSVGDIVEDITNSITKARAYEEMQEVVGEDGLRSRVIVEYKGKKTQMQPSSAIIEFSPDGRYLLYLANTGPKHEDGTYLYNVETGKTQELIPPLPDTDPNRKPYPEEPKWGKNTITYEKSGTWTLAFKEE